MSLERIRELLTQLPGHSLVHGGSHAGKLYQNYPWPPLDVLPAHRHDTQARLDWLLGKLGNVKDRYVLDCGCANGAIAIGLRLKGALINGITPDAVESGIANYADKCMGAEFSNFFAVDATYILDKPRNIVLCLSVWKWIVRNQGMEAANGMLRKLNAKVLIFESGLTDGGLDLGIGITKADIPDILRKHTGCEPELLGIEPREDGTEREVWRCRRNV